MRAERRKSARIAKQFSATAERLSVALPEGLNRMVHVLILDVSRDGVGFVSREPFDRDAMLRLNIDTAGLENAGATGRHFVALATVRYCLPVKSRGRSGYRGGAQFKSLSSRETEAWNDHLRRWTGKLM